MEIALALGFFGSLHCIGMCGPILLALPTTKSNRSQFFLKLVYHSSRSIGYGILGFLFGIFGSSVSLLGIQRWVSITSGILILVALITPIFWTSIEARLYQSTFIKKIQLQITKQFKHETFASHLRMGLLNSFLPCGFVYIALVGSINQHSILDSALYMVAFGFGTIPLMLTYTLFSQQIKRIRFLKSPKIKATLTTLVAILFILRGLELGIPYLSPKIKITETQVESSCCTTDEKTISKLEKIN